MAENKSKLRRRKRAIRSVYSGKIINGKDVISVDELDEYLRKIGYFKVRAI